MTLMQQSELKKMQNMSLILKKNSKQVDIYRGVIFKMVHHWFFTTTSIRSKIDKNRHISSFMVNKY